MVKNSVNESKVKSENFYVVHSWMIRELNVNRIELDIYAIIFGFSKEENCTFNGSLRYLMDWTKCSRRAVIYNLQSLEKKGYIKKIEHFNNGVKLCEYYATKTRNEKSAPGVVQEMHQGGAKGAKKVVQEMHQGGANDAPNNIEDNINNNILRKKERLVQMVHQGGANDAPNNIVNNINNILRKKERKEDLNDNSLFKRENENEIKKISAEKNSTEKKKISFDEIIENYTQNEELRTELKEHLRVRKAKRAALTDHALELSLKKLDSIANSDEQKIEIVQNSTMNGWTAFYPLRTVKTNSISGSNYNINNYEKTMDVFDAQVKEEERKKAKAEARAKVIELAEKEHEENVRKYDEKYAQELEECEDLEEYKSTKEYFNHLLAKGFLLDGTCPPEPKTPEYNLFENIENEEEYFTLPQMPLAASRTHESVLTR